ncbi:MAG TPA: NapH/MauN family ferredoxin-type protein [Bacteroidales bacterium]|nr:NapH/MauN family ferredoxin-type protein [Bacteroidales bacterium]
MPHTLAGMTFNEWRQKKQKSHKWRNIRWSVVIGLSVLFILSFALDLSILEGSLSGSRLLGFYLIDPYNSLQMLAISSTTGYIVHLTMNFWIGLGTIVLFYAIMGGRTYCSWVCPYHLLAEWTDKMRDLLVRKYKWKDHTFHRSIRYVFWIGFILVAFFTKNLVFEDVNMVGILSRTMIYGPGLILLWVLGVILFEVLYSKRFWCRYVCPLGTTMGMIGSVAPLSIKFEHDKCGYCRDCQTVCLVPHVLWFVQRGKATQAVHYTGQDCTRCGLCVDSCPGGALSYSFKGIDKLT